MPQLMAKQDCCKGPHATGASIRKAEEGTVSCRASGMRPWVPARGNKCIRRIDSLSPFTEKGLKTDQRAKPQGKERVSSCSSPASPNQAGQASLRQPITQGTNRECTVPHRGKHSPEDFLTAMSDWRPFLRQAERHLDFRCRTGYGQLKSSVSWSWENVMTESETIK